MRIGTFRFYRPYHLTRLRYTGCDIAAFGKDEYGRPLIVTCTLYTPESFEFLLGKRLLGIRIDISIVSWYCSLHNTLAISLILAKNVPGPDSLLYSP